MKKILLLVLALISILNVTSCAQEKRYDLLNRRTHAMGQVFDEPMKGKYITIDEANSKIELHEFANDGSDRIFKIVKQYSDPKDENVTLYDVKLPLTEKSDGMLFFQINKFYKIIRYGGGHPGVPNLKNYLEYQYK